MAGKIIWSFVDSRYRER